MMLRDLKFTETELGDKDISSLPDRPSDAGITAEELKARFDMIPKTLLALGKFNQMIDELGATEEGNSGADNIGVSPVVGTSGGTLQAVLGEMGDLTQAAKQAGEIAAAQGAAAVTAADNATAAANAATEKAENAESAAEIATSQGKEAAAAATAATAAIIEVKDYAAEQAQSAKDYVDQVILEGGVVSSVFGRAGAITAEAGDYTAEMITYGETNAAEGINAAAAVANAAQKTADAKSNDNLLDNWYFAYPIDQRGGYVVPPDTAYYSDTALTTQAGTVSAYTTANYVNTTYGSITVSGTTYYVAWSAAVRGYVGSGYGIDRWRTYATGLVALITDAGLKLINQGTATAYWMQYLETSAVSADSTDVVTLSALFGDGSFASVTGALGATTKLPIAGGKVTITKSSLGYYSPNFEVNANAEIAPIKAVKLELGDKQTLARKDANGNWVLNDPPPNKLIELLKCQYFYRLFATESARPKALADYHPPMRVNPATGTIDINGATYYYADANL